MVATYYIWNKQYLSLAPFANPNFRYEAHSTGRLGKKNGMVRRPHGYDWQQWPNDDTRTSLLMRTNVKRDFINPCLCNHLWWCSICFEKKSSQKSMVLIQKRDISNWWFFGIFRVAPLIFNSIWPEKQGIDSALHWTSRVAKSSNRCLCFAVLLAVQIKMAYKIKKVIVIWAQPRHKPFVTAVLASVKCQFSDNEYFQRR